MDLSSPNGECAVASIGNGAYNSGSAWWQSSPPSVACSSATNAVCSNGALSFMVEPGALSPTGLSAFQEGFITFTLLIGAAIGWSINAIISLAFPVLVEALHFGTFLIFALICFLATLFMITSAPETRGRTLEDLEEQFQDKYRSL